MRPFNWDDFEREAALYADPEVTKHLPRGASRRVMEKLGMRYEGEVDVYGLHAVRYALSRGEFVARA